MLQPNSMQGFDARRTTVTARCVSGSTAAAHRGSTLWSGRQLATVALLVVAAVWGSTYLITKQSLLGLSPFVFIALRFAFASAGLVPLVLSCPTKRWPKRREWQWAIMAGLSLAGGQVFQAFALQLLPSGRAGFIINLNVLMVPLLAWLLLRQKITGRTALGLSLALLGLGLLSYAPGNSLLGDLLALLSAFCFAVQFIAIDKIPKEADGRSMSLIQSVCVMSFCGIFLLPEQSRVGLLSYQSVLVTALMGLCATAVALTIQIWAQRQLKSTNAALLLTAESPFSMLFGYLYGGESLTNTSLIAGLLMLLGTLFATTNRSQNSESSAAPGRSF